MILWAVSVIRKEENSVSSLTSTFCSRPRTVGDVAHQEEVVRALQKAMQSSNVRPFTH